MGYIRHELDIAEFDAFRREDYAALVAWRETLEPQWKALIIGPVDAVTNAYVWFVMLPDGSKEGWEDSDIGDDVRAEFRTLCRDRWGRSTLRLAWGDDPATIEGDE